MLEMRVLYLHSTYVVEVPWIRILYRHAYFHIRRIVNHINLPLRRYGELMSNV
jgi:hypothetical protein